MADQMTRDGLSLLEAGLRAQPSLVPEVLAMAWRAGKGHRCRHCTQPIKLSFGGGAPYWFHEDDASSSVWRSGWGDPASTGAVAEPGS